MKCLWWILSSFSSQQQALPLLKLTFLPEAVFGWKIDLIMFVLLQSLQKYSTLKA